MSAGPIPEGDLAWRIERATLAAWPAEQCSEHIDWLLRFSGGYTKRANSANGARADAISSMSGSDVVALVTHCEAAYAERGLPAILRLTSLLAEVELLDRVLLERGYLRVDPTRVQAAPLGDAAVPAPSDVATLSPDDWLSLYSRLDGETGARLEQHRRLIARIPGECCLAALVSDGETVACGLGVLDNGCYGLFDIVVASELRRRGYGRRLVCGMMGWAAARRADCCYLQVVEENADRSRDA